MKSKLKQLLVNCIFRVGDTVSRTKLYRTRLGYWVYSKAMNLSSDLQDKWNLPEPWKDVQ